MTELPGSVPERTFEWLSRVELFGYNQPQHCSFQLPDSKRGDALTNHFKQGCLLAITGTGTGTAVSTAATGGAVQRQPAINAPKPGSDDVILLSACQRQNGGNAVLRGH